MESGEWRLKTGEERAKRCGVENNSTGRGSLLGYIHDTCCSVIVIQSDTDDLY